MKPPPDKKATVIKLLFRDEELKNIQLLTCWSIFFINEHTHCVSVNAPQSCNRFKVVEIF